MSFFQALLTGGGSDVIWTMGDSISRGNSDAVGETPPILGSVKQWDAGNSNLRDITNLDLLEPVAAGAIGSQWPRFGITYYERTGRVPVFVNCGVGGSAFFNPSAGFSWYTNDTLFSNALTKVQNCLAYMGKSAPRYVIIGSGYNDTVQGHALDFTYITSLVDRVLAAFPGVEILFTLPFSNSASIATYANLTRLYQIRKWIKSLMWLYPTVGICGDLSVIHSWGSGFQADNVHLNEGGNAFLGDKSAIGLTAGNQYHKYTRGVISTMYWRISTTRKGWLDTFITTLETAGLLEQLDSLLVPANAGDDTDGVGWKNCIQDFAFISNHSPADTLNYTDYTYQGYFPDGLADAERISNTPITLAVDKANLSNDFFVGIYLASNAVSSGTAAAPFGVRESAAGGIVLMRQNAAGNIGVFAGSTVETTDATETAFTSGLYWLARNSGNQLFGKDTTTKQNAAVAAAALSPVANVRGLSIGNYNSNGTIQLRWAGGVKAFVIAKWTTISSSNNLSSTFKNALDAFLADWLTNVP